MWTAVAMAVVHHAQQNPSPEQLLLKEEIELRVTNTAVKELWDRYCILKTLQDPYAEIVKEQYDMILALSRK